MSEINFKTTKQLADEYGISEVTQWRDRYPKDRSNSTGFLAKFATQQNSFKNILRRSAWVVVRRRRRQSQRNASDEAAKSSAL
jgi:hypothetical protein